MALPTNTDSSQTRTSNKSLFYNPTFRAVIFQIIAVVALVFFFYSIINNALTNLGNTWHCYGMFDFLNQEAGFGIGLTLIDYDETFSYGRTFLVGLLNTALIAVLGVILATILGFIIGVARLSPNWLVSRFAAFYIEIFRNIPLLLQIFFGTLLFYRYYHHQGRVFNLGIVFSLMYADYRYLALSLNKARGLF